MGELFNTSKIRGNIGGKIEMGVRFHFPPDGGKVVDFVVLTGTRQAHIVISELICTTPPRTTLLRHKVDFKPQLDKTEIFSHKTK